MGEKTAIEWTHHTFNPWWGCTKVSPACEHCYAESHARRFGVGWGDQAIRKPASEATWAEPLRWARAAEKAGERRRVFCASMADVFDLPRMQLHELRERLWTVIAATPWLDWLLLTKRPQHILGLVPIAWRDGFPPNVWVGTTVEDQRRAEARIPSLLRVPARVRFLSCEPLLGPLVLDPWLRRRVVRAHEILTDRMVEDGWSHPDGDGDHGGLQWVIAGGESGHGARPTHPDWFRAVRDQCEGAGVPFLLKQWGAWAPREDGDRALYPNGEHLPNLEPHLGSNGQPSIRVRNVGKAAAGRVLDGVVHDDYPTPRSA